MPKHPSPSSTAARRPTRAALSLLGLLAAGVLASMPAHSELSTSRCGAMPAPEEALRQLNAARIEGATCHRSGDRTAAAPVRWSASLQAAAQTQSEDMASLGRMGHRDRMNRGLGERLSATGYRFSTAVENVAVGYPSVDAVVAAWLRSEGHCDNLMDPAALELGLACSDAGGADGGRTRPDEIGGRRYWTLVLGAPRAVR